MKNNFIPVIHSVGKKESSPYYGTLSGNSWDTDLDGFGFVTPTVGSDILTNGNMETGTPPSNWTVAGSSATVDSVVDERTGGIGTKSIEATWDNNARRFYQQFTATTAQWLQVTCWAKLVSGPLDTFIFQVREFDNSGTLTIASPGVILSDEWQQFYMVARILTDNPYIIFRSPNGLLGVQQKIRVDDVSAKYMTLSTMLATVDTDDSNVDINASIYVKSFNLDYRVPAGVICNLNDSDSPTDFILAYHDTEVFRAVKCVSGIYTLLINNTVSYVEGISPRIYRSAEDTYQFFYNGVKIDTDKIINDVSIVDNTIHGVFSSFSSIRFGRVTINGNRYNFPKT